MSTVAVVGCLGATGAAIYLVTDDRGPSHPDDWNERLVDLVAFDTVPRVLAVDALTLPTVRAPVMLAAGGTAGDASEAFGVADCFVRVVPFPQLVQANESSEPPAAVVTAIERAVADCRVA